MTDLKPMQELLQRSQRRQGGPPPAINRVAARSPLDLSVGSRHQYDMIVGMSNAYSWEHRAAVRWHPDEIWRV